MGNIIDYQKVNNTNEEICNAISAIAQSIAKNLQHDKTIVCTITDNIHADLGYYTVSDGASSFIAFSENQSYKKEEKVYVIIPNNDFSMQKNIIGKYYDENNIQQLNNSFKNYIQITENKLQYAEYKQFIKVAIKWREENAGPILCPYWFPYSGETDKILTKSDIKEYSVSQENIAYPKDISQPATIADWIKEQLKEKNYYYNNEDVFDWYDEYISEYKYYLSNEIIANGDIDESPIAKFENSNPSAYDKMHLSDFTRMGISAIFDTTALKAYKKGNYGLRLKIKATTKDLPEVFQDFIFDFDSSEMYGNIYSLSNIEQKTLFDISDLYKIKNVFVYLYQKGNFVFNDKNTNRIKISNVQLTFGYDNQTQLENSVYLYCDSKNYDSSNNRKDIFAVWVYKDPDTQIWSRITDSAQLYKLFSVGDIEAGIFEYNENYSLSVEDQAKLNVYKENWQLIDSDIGHFFHNQYTCNLLEEKKILMFSIWKKESKLKQYYNTIDFINKDNVIDFLKIDFSLKGQDSAIDYTYNYDRLYPHSALENTDIENYHKIQCIDSLTNRELNIPNSQNYNIVWKINGLTINGTEKSPYKIEEDYGIESCYIQREETVDKKYYSSKFYYKLSKTIGDNLDRGSIDVVCYIYYNNSLIQSNKVRLYYQFNTWEEVKSNSRIELSTTNNYFSSYEKFETNISNQYRFPSGSYDALLDIKYYYDGKKWDWSKSLPEGTIQIINSSGEVQIEYNIQKETIFWDKDIPKPFIIKKQNETFRIYSNTYQLFDFYRIVVTINGVKAIAPIAYSREGKYVQHSGPTQVLYNDKGEYSISLEEISFKENETIIRDFIINNDNTSEGKKQLLFLPSSIIKNFHDITAIKTASTPAKLVKKDGLIYVVCSDIKLESLNDSFALVLCKSNLNTVNKENFFLYYKEFLMTKISDLNSEEQEYEPDIYIDENTVIKEVIAGVGSYNYEEMNGISNYTGIILGKQEKKDSNNIVSAQGLWGYKDSKLTIGLNPEQGELLISDPDGYSYTRIYDDGIGTIYSNNSLDTSVVQGELFKIGYTNDIDTNKNWPYPYLRMGLGTAKNDLTNAFIIVKTGNGIWIGNNGSANISMNVNGPINKGTGIFINFANETIDFYEKGQLKS